MKYLIVSTVCGEQFNDLASFDKIYEALNFMTLFYQHKDEIDEYDNVALLFVDDDYNCDIIQYANYNRDNDYIYDLYMEYLVNKAKHNVFEIKIPEFHHDKNENDIFHQESLF